MPPMLFTALVGLLINLVLAGLLPAVGQGVHKLDGVAPSFVSRSITL